MTLTLDPATEQRLQQELATGPYREPSALIAHLLDLIQAERDEESALRSALAEKLQRGYDQASRGELYSPEEARAILAARRSQMLAEIEDGLAQLDRGEFVTEEQLRAGLAVRRSTLLGSQAA